jgi:ATP-dependent DNA helicase PIF1
MMDPTTTMHRNKLSLEQEYSLQLFEAGQNILITGPAGTGKTCLIKQIMASSVLSRKKIQICAMTGCAAIILGCNATTLHSWSGIRLAKGTAQEIYDSIKINKKQTAKWRTTSILVVDEVSMMSKRIFDILNFIGKKIRCDARPFGGLQLVFTGDFYQLPPVSGAEVGSGLFCFESADWESTFLWENHVELKTVFRQKDPVYKEILNNIRVGKIDAGNIAVLNSCVNRPYDKAKYNGCVPTKLFAIHRKVEEINQQMFNAINEPCFEYSYVKKKDCLSYMESFNKLIGQDILAKCRRELTEPKTEFELDYMINNCPCERILRLKKGANVMCTVNLDMDAGICNGSIGVIVDFIVMAGISFPIVLFSNGIKRQMPLKYWQSEEYPTLAIGQIPLRLAWAITIHKIQGATLPMAEIDIGNTIFECGQSYVALSRVQNLEGLYLSGFRPDKIKVHPTVFEFYKKIPQIEYQEEEEEVDGKELSFEEYAFTIKTVFL